MWKEPDEKSLDAPIDMKKQIRNSIYWNSEGRLYKSPKIIVLQNTVIVVLFATFFGFLVASFIETMISNNVAANIVSFVSVVTIFVVLFWIYYQWGWNSYQEAWYHFDKQEEIFSVIRKTKNGWELIEIPYEEIEEIQYVEGSDGKAIIKSGPFEFETNRDSEKRASSVVEIWPYLAGTKVTMKNWPIKMFCQKCKRDYGHHIGTAICPFCELALIDSNAKGRFDPITQHDDDLDRI